MRRPPRAIAYTPELSRLIRIQCRRGAESPPLQDLTRGYDPVGNVVSLANGVEPTRLISNQTVSPDTTYQYDARYRLRVAAGRCAKQPTPAVVGLSSRDA